MKSRFKHDETMTISIVKTYKVRLYPNKQQEERFFKIIGASRFVWNHFLAGKEVSMFKNGLELTTLRQKERWMLEIARDCLDTTLKGLEAAYRSFFKGCTGYPKFRSKKAANQYFQKKDISIHGNRISLSRGLKVKFRGRVPEGKLCTVTVTLRNGKWYAAIPTKQEIIPAPITGAPIGIDLGLKDLAILSTGRKIENQKFNKKNQVKLAKLQKELSRKKKGSNRRAKAKVELARLHEAITNERLNYLHQVSHSITSENQALIVVEDLATKNMMKNHKLAGAISDASWGEFVRQLEYKQIWNGGEFMKINRFYPSSKTCSDCSHILKALPLSIREWECPKCFVKHDRDINAAKVILQEGLRNSPVWRERMVSQQCVVERELPARRSANGRKADFDKGILYK